MARKRSTYQVECEGSAAVFCSQREGRVALMPPTLPGRGRVGPVTLVPTTLGVDLGTSGLKLVLLARDGSVVAESEAAYDVEHPRPGRSESAPTAWTTALGAALDDLAARAAGLGEVAVRAVGVAGQMHAAVLVDAAGDAVVPAVLWTDARATARLDRWRALPDAVRAPLANPLVPGMTGPVLDWFAAHDPVALDRAAHVLLPKDVVRAWLVDDAALPVATTDRSDAAGTLLWDVPADAWAADVVAHLDLPARLLPGVAPSDAVAGTTARVARWFPASGTAVPVVVGGGDTPAARLAVGAPGLHVNLGTGAQVMAALDQPQPALDPVVHTFADTGSGPAARWYRLAAVQNAGLALGWALRVLGLGWSDGLALARTVPDGAGGVTFLPFLTGERGGVAGPGARGAWTGLREDTGRPELVRAAVEGMVFAVAAAVDLLETAPGAVVVTGGGSRDPLVRRLLADALGRPVHRVGLRSATAVGAALLAARGTGDPVEPVVATDEPELPGPGRADVVEHLARWREATAALG
ncbi:carbohydrate kinase [Sphaerisporangium cinnabarinum]|nr:carbohydrate kinase [Sphaerisporangium cinnabarinum]